MEPFAEIQRQIRETHRALERSFLQLRMGQKCDRAELGRLFGQQESLRNELHSLEDPWAKVQLAREPGRPHAREAIRVLFGDFVPLGGARGQGDDPALLVGLGDIGGRSVVFAGQERGGNPKDRLTHHFGMMAPEGFRKFQRAARFAESKHLPLLTFVDTPSAMPGIEAEERGIAQSIARSLWLLAGLKTPTLAIVFGEGGSGGALAMTLCDRVLMMENAVYSVISPEGCASILWRDGGRAVEAAGYLQLTAADQLKRGIADEIIGEPPGGAHVQPLEALAGLRLRVRGHLTQLEKIPLDTLLQTRRQRYRSYGQWQEAQAC